MLAAAEHKEYAYETRKRWGLAIARLQRRQVLPKGELRLIFREILEAEDPVSDVYWGALCGCLMTKGVESHELSEMAAAIQDYDPTLSESIKNKLTVNSGRPLISLAGSGKDTMKTFNVSTTAAFIISAAGPTVIKPGSKATSSVSGAVDVLEELGVPIFNDKHLAKKAAETHGLSFINILDCVPRFARRYDGKFFNFSPLSYFLMPLCFPFKADCFVYGIANDNVDLSANMLDELGYERGAIVSSKDDHNRTIDEYIPGFKSRIAILNNRKITVQVSRARRTYAASDFAHTDSHKGNAGIVQQILQNRAGVVATQIAIDNAAIALYASGASPSYVSAQSEARQVIRTGEAWNKVEELRRGDFSIRALNRSHKPLTSPKI